MLQHCLFCHNSFPGNDVLQHFPIGARVAYDPARGRLWCVCRHCHGWTLAPIEMRWEALEELERLARDRGKLLIQSENVALIDAGSIQLIRIGRAGRREEAWWRYGREFGRRRERARKVVRKGKIMDSLVMLALVGLPIWAWSDAQGWIDGARRRTFGTDAWRGDLKCETCGKSVRALSFARRAGLRLLSGDELKIGLPCRQCADRSQATLSGLPALLTFRRVLAYHNFTGATEAQVADANRLIELAGSSERALANTLVHQPPLGSLEPVQALAVEISLNESSERVLLELEVAEIEAQWREAEQIAAIADSELT